MFLGKNFLNTIEYLDDKANEWTTFIPKGPCDFVSRRKPRSRKNSRKSMSEDSRKQSFSSSNDIAEIVENGAIDNVQS